MEKEVLALLNKIRSGDESAFAELSEKYKTMSDSAVYRFSRSLESLGSDVSCGIDDLRQHAAVALYRAAMTYEPDVDGKGRAVSFGLYAKICVNNALVSVFRKQRSAKKRAETAARREKSLLNERRLDPLEGIIAGESADALMASIKERLSPYENEVLDCFISGKPVREIASCLGTMEKSVSNALYRIKRKVKDILE